MDTTPGYTPQTEEKKSFWDANKMLIKSMLIGVLTLVMLIPASFTRELVYEREDRQQQVIAEVSSKWALEQTVKGPILAVPYLVAETQPDKSVVNVKKLAYIMPDQLSLNGVVDPEQRHRSIYDVTLYRSKLQAEGSFKPVDFAVAGIAPGSLLLHEARLLIGISDVRGLEQDITLELNDVPVTMDAGVPANDLLSSGLSKAVSWDPTQALSFRFNLLLKGSSALNFAPVGKTTKVNLQSSWQHPSFEGKFLPSEQASIDQAGFRSAWNVLQISSGIPSVITNQAVSLAESSFGVKLIQPADGYAKTQRSVKYALLFISLTFTIFFFIEVLQKKQIHPLQYLLVGLALCVFYTLLLSFTEYIGFNFSYGISATATVSLIGLYVWGVFKSGKIAFSFTAALSALYAYIFVLIQLEDFALLFGSTGLFILLAIIMYYSRKIDWYGTLKQAGRH
ncbi:MAG: cell envelope integrity protein CreD [Chitinophagaceae bacterium]|nr:cell envelope integrity protein CreD [Chitinophagaceae bacterium]